jgi:hypothetical protein
MADVALKFLIKALISKNERMLAGRLPPPRSISLYAIYKETIRLREVLMRHIMRTKPRDININHRPPESWSVLASTLLRCGHRWTPWQKRFLADMANPSKQHPSEKQIERLLELDARAWL